MARRLSPLDATFLWLERGSMLGHVAGLQIFSIPADAPDDFMQKLVGDLRRPLNLDYPWNQKLQRSPLQRVAPAWVTDNDVDMDYHVRHLSLPRPGGERELGVMISRLHSLRLDRRRPLWECHIIEGLEGNRFALYTKIHHALVDGVTTVRLMSQCLSDTPKASVTPPWALKSSEAASASTGVATSLLDVFRGSVGVLPQVGKAIGRVARSAITGNEKLAVPFAAPASPLNVPTTIHRRFATQQFDLARIKAVGKATDTTINDVVMSLTSAALRRFLEEGGSLPKSSLTAAIPVSLRPADGDASAGNNAAIVLAGIASNVADPVLRLKTVHENMQNVKLHMSTLSASAMKAYTAAMLGPFFAQLLAGLSGRTRPFFNLIISNVPGPREALYMGGAKLEALYPVSNPFDGQALNVTCTSYAGTLNFGFTGCRDSLKHMQRIAVYTGEALDELEAALNLNTKPRRKAA